MKLNIFLKAKLLSLFLVTMLFATTVNGQALQATGGTGTLRNQIWWADFSGVSLASGGTLSRNFNIGNIVVTVTLSNVSFSGSAKTSPPGNVLTTVRLVGYKSGSWREDGLDNLYNIGGTGPSNSLTNALNTNFGGVSGGATGTNNTLISNFKITAYATLNGKPISLAMVYASAEADGNAPAPNNPLGIEYTQGTTNGSPWQLIEKFTTPNQSTGNRLISFSNSDLTALMSMGSSNQGTSEANATPSNVAILYTGKNATSSSNSLVVDAKMVSGGSSAIAIGFIVGVDNGDLPASFGSSRNSLVPVTTGGTNPNPGVTQNTYLANGLTSPTPIINPGTLVNPTNLKIGTNAADPDLTTVNSATANGDDITGTDDEDGLDAVTIGGLYSGLTSYSLNNIPVTNTTGSSAILAAWVDFNQNGTFETGEGTTVTVANGATSASLSWTGLSGVVAGKVNIRLKLSTDTDLTTATPTGESIDGETEDYQFTVCNSGTSQVVLSSTALNTCSPNTVDLNTAFTGTAPGGASLVWFTNNAHTGTALTLAQSQAAGVGTYYAFFYDSVNGCYNVTTSTSSVVVTVTSGAPTLGAISGPSCTVSPASGIAYSVPAVPGATSYTWSYTPALGTTSGIVAGQGTRFITMNFIESNPSGILSVTVTTACGTSAPSTLAITLLPKPSIATLGNSTICPGGGSILLTSTPAPAYQWYKDGVILTGETNQNYMATATGAYTVVTSSGSSCMSVTSDAFNVIQEDTTPPVFVSPLGSTTKNVKIDFRNISINNAINLPQTYQNIETGALANERIRISQSAGSGTAQGTTTTVYPATADAAGPAAYGNDKLLFIKNTGDPIRTYAFNFDQSVSNLKFSMYDIDGTTTLDARAYNNGVLQPITLTPLKFNTPRVIVSASPSTTPSLTAPANAYSGYNSISAMRTSGVNVDVPNAINSFILATTSRYNGDNDFYVSQISYDYTAPVLPPDVTVDCNAIPAPVVLTATDNCSAATVTYVQNPAVYTPSSSTQIITRTWTATDSSNNTSTYTQTITVNPGSKIPTVATSQTICATVHSSLANIAISGDNIKWYATATSIPVLPSTTLLVNGTTYYATQTLPGGCESSRVSVTVTLRNCSWVNPSLRFKGSK